MAGTHTDRNLGVRVRALHGEGCDKWRHFTCGDECRVVHRYCLTPCPPPMERGVDCRHHPLLNAKTARSLTSVVLVSVCACVCLYLFIFWPALTNRIRDKVARHTQGPRDPWIDENGKTQKTRRKQSPPCSRVQMKTAIHQKNTSTQLTVQVIVKIKTKTKYNYKRDEEQGQKKGEKKEGKND